MLAIGRIEVSEILGAKMIPVLLRASGIPPVAMVGEKVKC